MKPTEKQLEEQRKQLKELLEEQRKQLKELLENAEYEIAFDDGLISEIQIKMSVFSRAMERTIAGGFDPLNEKQMKALSEYWYELNENISTALDILEMASSTIRGSRYDIEQPGNFNSYTSLGIMLDAWKKRKEDEL